MTLNRDPFNIYLFIVGMRQFAFTAAWTMLALYLVRELDVSAFQLVLPGAAFEVAIFLFEVPTGVVADVYSRRLSVIIGNITIGIGLIVTVLVPNLSFVILGTILCGIGGTFVSGALSAWLVDEVGQDRAATGFLRSAQIAPFFGVSGLVVSVLLASADLSLSIAVGGGFLIATGLILIAVMPETGFKGVPPEDRETWGDLFNTFRAGIQYIRLKTIFLWIFMATFFVGAFGEGFMRLWPLIVLDGFSLPEIAGFGEELWFGIIRAGSIPLTLLTTEWVRRRVDLTDSRSVVNALFASGIGLIVVVLMVALSPVFGAVLIGLWAMRALFSVTEPLLETWINQHIDSDLRATILSVNGQVNSFGEMLGGPIVGGVASFTTVRFAISASTILMMAALGVFRSVPHGVVVKADPQAS